MDLQRPKTTTDCRKLVRMVQYYHNMWKRHSHVLSPRTQDSVGNKGKQIEWTKDLEQDLLYIKRAFSEETILNYLYW